MAAFGLRHGLWKNTSPRREVEMKTSKTTQWNSGGMNPQLFIPNIQYMDVNKSRGGGGSDVDH